MKRFRVLFIALIILTAIFSTYSALMLTATGDVKYSWYSDYTRNFICNTRSYSFFEWEDKSETELPEIHVIFSAKEAAEILPPELAEQEAITKFDFKKMIMIYATLGNRREDGYLLRFSGVKIRSQIMYIRISVNGPPVSEDSVKYRTLSHEYEVFDLISVDRTNLVINQNYSIVFEDQSGNIIKTI